MKARMGLKEVGLSIWIQMLSPCRPERLSMFFIFANKY